jgi:hypothetical protein
MTTKVFIGGSRHVSRLGSPIRKRIDNIVAKNLPVVIGDANGADKAVQTYLYGKGYSNVEVFCSDGKCRNNVGNWNVRSIPVDGHDRGVQFYSAKDRAMTHAADIGLMVWDGKSAGTLLNVMRLISLKKKVVIYIVPSKEFKELRRDDDWQVFFSHCTAELRSKVEERASQEIRSGNADLQTAFAGF